MGLACHLARYAAIAARKTMRPVKVVYDYSMGWEGNSFETGIARYNVGFNNDGTMASYYHWCNGGMLRQLVPRLYDYQKQRIRASLTAGGMTQREAPEEEFYISRTNYAGGAR